MNRRDVIKVKVMAMKNGIVFVAPRCSNAMQMCLIASTPFLDTMHLIYIQKLGFKIEIIKD